MENVVDLWIKPSGGKVRGMLLLVLYTIAIKLSIFYTIPIFEVMKNNLSLGLIRHVYLYFGYQI